MLTNEEHLFACIAEEAGEIAQIAGKILRFGPLDAHEKTGNVPNFELLVSEVNELLALMGMLSCHGFDTTRLDRKIEKFRKTERVKHYMGYARERGTLW